MAGEATSVFGLAGRYATALLELAREREALAEVADDLAAIRGLLDESDDLRRLVRSPVIGREAQGRVMAALADRFGFGELVRNFLGLLARNRRLFALDAMIGAYQALLAEHRGELTAEVRSAAPLSERQSAAIAAALERAVGRKVRLSARVDAALLGGLAVKVGSRMIDASLAARLRSLRLAMKGAR